MKRIIFVFILLLMAPSMSGMGFKKPKPEGFSLAHEGDASDFLTAKPELGLVLDGGAAEVSFTRNEIINYTHVTAKITSTNQYRIDRVRRLIKRLEKVLNSPELKRDLEGAYYRGKPGFASSSFSPKQVYIAIMQGNEINSGIDNKWQMVFLFARNRMSVLGWTNPSTIKVWFNSRNFDGRSDCPIVGTMAHEQAHKLKFGHDFKATARRPYSVPYVLGTIVTRLCRTIK